MSNRPATADPAVTVVYTDGSCSGNPGPGGWAWVIPDGAWASGSENPTTNQRMEVAAVLDALRSLPGPIAVHSDSTYVVNCFRDAWWEGWIKRGWTNAAKKPVANRDLWEPLIEEYRQRLDAGVATTFVWVKGHSGQRWNERADELAVAAGTSQAGRQTGTGDVSDHQAEPATEKSRSTKNAANRPAGTLLAIAGHRPPEVGGWKYPNAIADAVIERLEAIISAKAQMDTDLVVVTGMGLGVEQFGAMAAQNIGVPYVAVLAFPDPSAVWPADSRQRFDELVDAATDVLVLERTVPESKAKIAAALQRRDEWLATNADEAIVVWDGSDRLIAKSVDRLQDALGDDVWIIDPAEIT